MPPVDSNLPWPLQVRWRSAAGNQMHCPDMRASRIHRPGRMSAVSGMAPVNHPLLSRRSSIDTLNRPRLPSRYPRLVSILSSSKPSVWSVQVEFIDQRQNSFFILASEQLAYSISSRPLLPVIRWAACNVRLFGLVVRYLESLERHSDFECDYHWLASHKLAADALPFVKYQRPRRKIGYFWHLFSASTSIIKQYNTRCR